MSGLSTFGWGIVELHHVVEFVVLCRTTDSGCLIPRGL